MPSRFSDHLGPTANFRASRSLVQKRPFPLIIPKFQPRRIKKRDRLTLILSIYLHLTFTGRKQNNKK